MSYVESEGIMSWSEELTKACDWRFLLKLGLLVMGSYKISVNITMGMSNSGYHVKDKSVGAEFKKEVRPGY